MTRRELWEISPELKNISAGNMARRNGSAKSVRRSMQFSRIGRLIAKSVEPESTSVIAEHSFRGKLNHIFPFI